ncbi:MAG: FprA family A-type flavoprotein [Bacteroidales bacterium]|nr:FprA family A-type flavoprotein [Bacteroidales bacterium]
MDEKIISVNNTVTWVGVLDYDIKTFDVVMETEFGTTYNSYFINADKKAVVETVKEKFWPVYEQKLRQVCNPAEIEYIIVNHTEPDHTGSIMYLLKLAPKAKIVGSGNAIRYLKDLVNEDFEFIIVKDGDELDLGSQKIQFISAPNLHWPDTIYSYLPSEKLLFTCDSFGAHFCHPEMIDDKVGNYDEAFKYYFDVILKPFSKFFLKAIAKISALDIKAILPGHGPMLLNDWEKYVNWSKTMAEDFLKNPAPEKVLVAYVSAYQKTANLAKAIAEGINKNNKCIANLVDIENLSLGELDQLLTESSGVVIGCPTINQNVLLPVYKLFAAVNPIRDKKKPAGAFGSFGWSGESMKILGSALEALKFDFVGDGTFVKFSPSEDDLAFANQYGQHIADKVISFVNAD